MGENAKGSAATVSGTPRSLISLKSIEKPCKSRTLQKETGHQSRYALYQNWCPVMVGVTGLEPMASWSRTKRATNCATPRKEKPQQLGCCGVVGDERIELPRAESESAALPLCESPSGLCLGRLPSTLIYYSVPDGICQRFF